jgi:hypothetical protein
MLHLDRVHDRIGGLKNIEIYAAFFHRLREAPAAWAGG